MALQASLNSEFTSHGMTAMAIVSAADARPDVLHARLMGEQFRIQENETLLGIASESIAGIMTRGAAGFVTSQKQQQERADRRTKEHNDTAFFLTLLNSGELDGYIADRIVDSMSDTEFLDFVAEIEAEVGMSLEEYAQGILGDDMPDRMPWESDIDYQRRVMNAAVEEVLEDGQIKPEYADDPLAMRIARNEIYQSMLPTINELNRVAPAEAAPDQQATEMVQEIAHSGYQGGDVLADELVNDALAGESRGIQDENSDDLFMASADAELDLFDSGTGIDFAAGPGLDGAPDVIGAFDQAAAEPYPQSDINSPAPELTATL